MTVLSVVSSLAAALTAVAQQEPPRFKAAVELVEVDAVVLDRSRNPVRGLTRDDFEIREDGRPVKIVTFVPTVGTVRASGEPDTPPAVVGNHASGRFVVLLLDDVFISPLRTPKIRELALQFIDRVDGQDEVAVVRLNGDQTRSTTSPEDARAAVRKYTRDRPPAPNSADEFRARVDGAMDTVGEIARQLSGVRHRRKALVFLGAPVMFVPTVPGPPSRYSPSWFGALRELARANVSLYYIDPRGLVPSGPDAAVTSPAGMFGAAGGGSDEQFDHGIAFANESGGAAFVRSNLFKRAIDQIWRETADYYLLGYEPPVNDGKSHKITVNVHRRGVEVRARKTR